ncbi:MAG: CoA transferase [Chloroflexi bacterium]|nr:CoA transferase [Chloroflexota bacterium]
MPGALQGVRVLDLSQMWAVPSAAVYLADQGADVIKVEPPRGDDSRRVLASVPIEGAKAAVNRHYLAVNRSKRGIAVDLRAPDGRAIIHRLSRWADVVLQNFRPGVAERLGVDYETLSALNPRLIFVSVTPYGPKGPFANRRAYDLLVQAHTGMLGLRRDGTGMPIPSGVWAADMSTPMLIAYGVTLALLTRERTGRGQKVETALLYGAVMMQAVDLVRAQTETETPRSLAAQALYAPYRCGDGEYLIIVVVSEGEWQALCRVLDLEHLAREPGLDSPAARAERSAELYPIFEAIFETRARDEWVRALSAEDVPCAPVLNRGEVHAHTQILENEMLVDVEHPGIGSVRMAGVPVRLSDFPPTAPRPAPALGAHTDEVLTELGYVPEEIARLRDQGIVV